MAVKPENAKKETDEFRCARRGVELTVEGCLTSQAAEVPRCKGCDVGGALAGRFRLRMGAEPKPTRSPAVSAPRRSLPVAPAPAAAPSPLLPPLFVPDVIPPRAVESAPWRAGWRWIGDSPAAAPPEVPELSVPEDLAARPVESAPWRAGSDEHAVETAPSVTRASDPTDPLVAVRESGLLPEAQEIADRNRVSLAEMFGKSHKRSPVNARAAFALVLRTKHGKSLPEIGWLLDGRDHTTVMSLLKRFEGTPPPAPTPEGAAAQCH